MNLKSVRTDSPIEEDFIAAVYAIGGGLVVFVPGASPDDLRQRANENREQVFVSSQVPVGKYRLDFLFGSFASDVFPKLICVECDGAEFHKKPHQRARDDQRDTALQSELITTRRLSGSQLRRDAFECAREVLNECGFFDSLQKTSQKATLNVMRQLQWRIRRWPETIGVDQ